MLTRGLLRLRLHCKISSTGSSATTIDIVPRNLSVGYCTRIPRTNMTTTKGLFNDTETEGDKSIVAIGQMCSTSQKKENFEQVKELVRLAKMKSARFLFLPECCDFVGENRQQTLQLSEPLSGPTVAAYKELARANELWISFGGIHEAIVSYEGTKTDRINNSHIVINDRGELVATYRKLHLFDVDTEDFRFRESDIVAKGQEIVAPLRTPIGNIGLQICYDVRFAEVGVILRKAGSDILTYPSAFAYSTGKAHWEVLLRARAIENQCFVIAPAQIGFHNDKRQSYGNAMIVDPWGNILAKCEGELDVVTAEINLSSLKRIRASMPCFQHRRSDMYSLTPVAFSSSVHERVDRSFSKMRIPVETIFYESQFCYAFTNLRCVVPGHVLVATKRPTPRLLDLSCDESADLFLVVCKIQKLLENIYKTTSSTVTVQDGPDAGQTVSHVHFHVMPRRKGDFEHNDLIYVELQQLEHAGNEKNRNINEMIEEAELYREYLKMNRNN